MYLSYSSLCSFSPFLLSCGDNDDEGQSAAENGNQQAAQCEGEGFPDEMLKDCQVATDCACGPCALVNEITNHQHCTIECMSLFDCAEGWDCAFRPYAGGDTQKDVCVEQ